MTWGLSRFSCPAYLDQRQEVEKILRQEFIEKEGNPSKEIVKSIELIYLAP